MDLKVVNSRVDSSSSQLLYLVVYDMPVDLGVRDFLVTVSISDYFGYVSELYHAEGFFFVFLFELFVDFVKDALDL